ncbi:MAG TPA: hypothetical protein VHJ54_04670 [Solirubrobacterales bacterium]|nr:hypothetical protein [Solirubrobacterales bacterium]
MIQVEQWAEIRRMHFVEGLAIKEIVRRTGRDRKTVRKAIRSDEPPHYERIAKACSKLDPHREQIARLLRDVDGITNTELRHRLGRGRERDPLTGEAGADSDRDRQVGLAGSRRPEQDHVLAGMEEVELAQVLDDLLLTERWKVKSNSSSFFRPGNRAVLIRFSPPRLSREATSAESTASKKRSCDHSSSRARSASLGVALAAAGAFRVRKRCQLRGLVHAGIRAS